ncbi:MAG: hypothetical protein ACOYXB_13530 [Bacteroidota bacterium]
MKYYSRITAALIFMLAPVMTINICAQNAVFTEFHAQLTDIDEMKIAGDTCDLTISLTDLQTGETLYTTSIKACTDESGWIAVNLGKQALKPGMKLQLDFLACDQSHWLGKGEKFSISYRFEKGSGMNGVGIVRSEGTELELTTIDGASVFNDPYPFAYIKGGFLISKGPKPEQILALRQKIDASYELPSRGVKGGFAVGGYNKQ